MSKVESRGGECLSMCPVMGGDYPKEDGVNSCGNAVYEAERLVVELLKKGYEAACSLASMRAKYKCSNTVEVGVARELNELIKVLSVHVRPRQKIGY